MAAGDLPSAAAERGRSRGARNEGFAVIRQAISCDICGAEKKQTNHWFVAWEQAGELRVSGWNSRNRLRAGAKHLCGQACLHKLADDFMARVIAQKAGARTAAAAQVGGDADAAATESAATGAGAMREANAEPAEQREKDHRAGAAGILPLLPAGPVQIPERLPVLGAAPPPDEPPRYATRTWHAQAWQRERERTQRPGERRPEIVARRLEVRE